MYLNMARVALKLSRHSEVVKYCNEVFHSRIPCNIETFTKAKYLRAKAYLFQRNYDLAFSDLKEALKGSPKDMAILQAMKEAKQGMEEDKKKSIQTWRGTLKNAAKDLDENISSVHKLDSTKPSSSSSTNILNEIWANVRYSLLTWWWLAVVMVFVAMAGSFCLQMWW